jgi:hypothetical protein
MLGARCGGSVVARLTRWFGTEIKFQRSIHEITVKSKDTRFFLFLNADCHDYLTIRAFLSYDSNGAPAFKNTCRYLHHVLLVVPLRVPRYLYT